MVPVQQTDWTTKRHVKLQLVIFICQVSFFFFFAMNETSRM